MTTFSTDKGYGCCVSITRIDETSEMVSFYPERDSKQELVDNLRKLADKIESDVDSHFEFCFDG